MATAAGINNGRARFMAACGVLSQYVKKVAEKAAVAAVVTESSSAAMVTLPLMPGADLSTTTQEEPDPETSATSCVTSQLQMTIFYGDRVLVLDDVPADRAAELLRLVATAKEANPHELVVRPTASESSDDLPMARKASLKRFMEKRKGRVTARATPYLRPDDGTVCHDRLELAL